MVFNKFIKSAADLVTSHEAIRTGFLNIALEKNRIGDPFVKAALTFKSTVSGITDPQSLLKMVKIRPFLASASGLSDKSLNYLDENDKTAVIHEFINKFLLPAGDKFIDEVIYRYLLIKGDSVGGTMRNRIGKIGERKLIRSILASLQVQGIKYDWCDNGKSIVWQDQPENDAGIEQKVRILHWKNNQGDRVLGFDMTIPLVRKNIDICLFQAATNEYCTIRDHPERGLMFGELKAGIDPAGADEHWKTGNTALERIRRSFSDQGYSVLTSFVGAAIAKNMATEIYRQLSDGTLSNASNLHDIDQLNDYCNWIVAL